MCVCEWMSVMHHFGCYHSVIITAFSSTYIGVTLSLSYYTLIHNANSSNGTPNKTPHVCTTNSTPIIEQHETYEYIPFLEGPVITPSVMLTLPYMVAGSEEVAIQ